jgi:hypothetical protein
MKPAMIFVRLIFNYLFSKSLQNSSFCTLRDNEITALAVLQYRAPADVSAASDPVFAVKSPDDRSAGSCSGGGFLEPESFPDSKSFEFHSCC